MIDDDHTEPREPRRAGARAEMLRMLKSDLVRFVRYVPADNAYPARGVVRLAKCGDDAMMVPE